MSIFFKSPKIMLVSGENKTNGLNHIKYWIPQFLKSKQKFVVLVRNEELYKALKQEFNTFKILLAKSALDVESVLNQEKDIKSIFYMSNTANNIHILRFIDYKHIFLGTENSDKLSLNSKILKVFDELWLNSQFYLDKINSELDISSLDIKIIGKHKYENIFDKNLEKNIVLFKFSKDSETLSNISLIVEFIKLQEKYMFIDIILDKDLEKTNRYFLNFKKQLDEIAMKYNVEYKINNSIGSEQLFNSSYIVCDEKSFEERFLLTNAQIFVQKDEYTSLDSIYFYPKFETNKLIHTFEYAKELNEMIKNEIKSEQKDEFLEYFIGKRYLEKNIFQNLLKSSIE